MVVDGADGGVACGGGGGVHDVTDCLGDHRARGRRGGRLVQQGAGGLEDRPVLVGGGLHQLFLQRSVKGVRILFVLLQHNGGRRVSRHFLLNQDLQSLVSVLDGSGRRVFGGGGGPGVQGRDDQGERVLAVAMARRSSILVERGRNAQQCYNLMTGGHFKKSTNDEQGTPNKKLVVFYRA